MHNRQACSFTTLPSGMVRACYAPTMNLCEICGRRYEYVRSKGGTKTTCNSCSVNRRRFKLRAKAIAYMGGECVRCGYKECLGVLHPHHVDPTKKAFRLSGAHSRSWDILCAEMDKCILLCANCHFKEHHPCDKYACGVG